MVDASDASADEGVMIALLPVDPYWCEIELPHLTLVYAGTTDKLGAADYNALAKDTAMLAMLTRPLGLIATGLEVFGGDGDPQVDVLRLRAIPELLAMRRTVERWNKSQHSFAPHVTIGPTKMGRDFTAFPRYIGFDRITVGWGNEYMTYKL